MKLCTVSIVGVSAILLLTVASQAEIKTLVEHSGSASAAFQFKNVPAPSQNDAATKATFTLVDGRRDANGGDLAELHDGKVPTEDDQPAENFFFAAGADGGRILVDLGSAIDIKQVNTYSWHPGTRGPQVYTLYAGDGQRRRLRSPAQERDRSANVRLETDRTGRYAVEAARRWRPVRRQHRRFGRRRSASIAICSSISPARRTTDPFGNTFYSEIDVVDPDHAGSCRCAPAATTTGEGRREIVETEGGTYQITIDTTETPDLTDWAHKDLAPVVRDWYPKLVKMLPSEGYEAPTQVSITFSASMKGVAATGGTRVRCAAGWFRQNLQGEAKGAVVHELVHVVQNYGVARRTNPNATRTPGWLVEGICDYIRWFLYEPQTRGAEITSRNIARARYDGNYRISGNFLNWVTETYGKDIVQRLNAAARAGKYSEDLWKTATGHTVQELGDEWKASMEKTDRRRRRRSREGQHALR